MCDPFQIPDWQFSSIYSGQILSFKLCGTSCLHQNYTFQNCVNFYYSFLNSISHLKHSACLFVDSKTLLSPTHCRLKVDFRCSVDQPNPQSISVNLAICICCILEQWMVLLLFKILALWPAWQKSPQNISPCFLHINTKSSSLLCSLLLLLLPPAHPYCSCSSLTLLFLQSQRPFQKKRWKGFKNVRLERIQIK